MIPHIQHQRSLLACLILAAFPTTIFGQGNWDQQLAALNAQNRSLEVLDRIEQIPAEQVTPAINYFHYRTLVRLDRRAEAQPLLARAVQKTEMEPYDYLLAACWYHDQGRVDQAMHYTEAAFQGAPDSTDTQLMLLEMVRDQVNRTRSDLALNRLAALGLRFRTDNPRIEREWIMNLSGWPTQRRIDELTRFCLAHPQDGQAHKYLGCLYVQLENGPRALPYLDRAVQLLPRQGNARLVRANALTQLGRIDEARDEHDRAIELEPTGISYHARGLFRLALGNEKEGLDDFLQAYRLNPSERRMLDDPVQVLTQRNRVESAIGFLDQVAKIDPSRSAALAYWKAWLQAELNQSQKALASIDTAIQGSQDDNLTRYARIRRVLLNLRFDRRDEAVQELSELEQLYPEDPYVQQARQQIEQSTLVA